MITGMIENNLINCYDGNFRAEDLRKWSTKGLIKCPACNKVI